MAHYAFLDKDNIVTEVIVGKDESDNYDWEQSYGKLRNQICKRTSYNGKIRKNYAGMGYIYDEQRDAFIPPKPFPSWILDEMTCRWVPPLDYPSDGKDYFWNETELNWEVLI